VSVLPQSVTKHRVAMSAKRKDSQPSRATPTKDCEDLNMHEENHEQSIGHTPWSSFPPLGQQTLHKGPGIQVSQLGQLLGQNGNGTMVGGYYRKVIVI